MSDSSSSHWFENNSVSVEALPDKRGVVVKHVEYAVRNGVCFIFNFSQSYDLCCRNVL